jgi:integrase/recombinase XerC
MEMELIDLKLSSDVPQIENVVRRMRSAIELWLAGFASEATRRAYRKELDAFAQFGGHADAETAMAAFLGLGDPHAHAAVDAWRAAKIDRGLLPATVNRSMSALNSFVASARRHGLTTLRLEARGMKSKAYRDTRGPGVDGVRDLLAIAEAQADKRKAARDAAIVLLAFGLGLRRNEIVSLDIGDVDLGSGTLAIMGKGRTEREKLTLSPELKEVLDRWLQFRRASDPAQPLFTSVSRASNDGRLTGDGIYKIVADLGERTGIRARPHGLRHAAVTAALDAFNGDFRKVRSFSRHASLDTVRKYDDSRADHGGAVAKVLTGLVRA